MPKWTVWTDEGLSGHRWWPAGGIGIVGLAVQIDNGQWFWFESKFYGFIDGLPEGRQVPDGMTKVRHGVQVTDSEMERVRAEAKSESSLELLKS